MFGEHAQDEMLSGLRSTGPSMFSGFGTDMTPNAKEMEEQAEAILYNKTVKFSGIKVHTFDLSDTKQSKAYAKTLNDIYNGIQARTHVILFNDRQFVTEVKPRWIAHIEWAEFKLEIKNNPTIGSPAAQETDDGEESS
jgi:hypothetical protein